jgi:hypothetical protein
MSDSGVIEEKFKKNSPLRVFYYLHEIVDQLKINILRRQLGEHHENDPITAGRLREELKNLSDLVEHAMIFFDREIDKFHAMPNLQALLAEDKKKAEEMIDLMLVDLST